MMKTGKTSLHTDLFEAAMLGRNPRIVVVDEIRAVQLSIIRGFAKRAVRWVVTAMPHRAPRPWLRQNKGRGAQR